MWVFNSGGRYDEMTQIWGAYALGNPERLWEKRSREVRLKRQRGVGRRWW